MIEHQDRFNLLNFEVFNLLKNISLHLGVRISLLSDMGEYKYCSKLVINEITYFHVYLSMNFGNTVYDQDQNYSILNTRDYYTYKHINVSFLQIIIFKLTLIFN